MIDFRREGLAAAKRPDLAEWVARENGLSSAVAPGARVVQLAQSCSVAVDVPLSFGRLVSIFSEFQAAIAVQRSRRVIASWLPTDFRALEWHRAGNSLSAAAAAI